MKTNANPSVTALVPAFNEEKGLVRVLKVLTGCSFINEVVCINDGSTDQTKHVISAFKEVKAINLPKNHGKSYSIVQGLRVATSDIVLLIDADITGLNEFWLRELIRPLTEESFEASIGYFSKVRMDKYFKPLGGQRAYFKEDLLPYLNSIQRKRFGLELYLNFLYKDKKVKLIPLLGIGNTLKHHKYSYKDATRMFLMELFDVTSEILRQKRPIDYFKQSYLHPFYTKKETQSKVKGLSGSKKYYFLGSIIFALAVLVYPSLAKANPPLYQNIKLKAQAVATAVENRVKENIPIPATFSVRLRKN